MTRDLSLEEKINAVVALLRRVRSILFITGAGISADSGLPTYRGIGGLYSQKETEDGIPIEMALAGQMLRDRPEITWKYLAQIEKNCRKARHNQAHRIIAEMERHFPRVWVLTQNIDGFHHQAGSRNIIDIHGDFHYLICLDCLWEDRVSDYSQLEIPPKCPRCKNIVRPQVVFFGEMLPEDKLRILQGELSKGFDLYFSIGTTSVFPYIQEPVFMAKRAHRPIVEINPGQTEVSEFVDIKIPLGAKEAMERIWSGYLARKGKD